MIPIVRFSFLYLRISRDFPGGIRSVELVAKIFETLEINQLALLQMGLVVVLAVVLSATLVRPILRLFEERENLSVRPGAEAKELLAKAEARAREYEESLRKASLEALARKRARMEEASRAERKRVESALEESNREIEAMQQRIAGERRSASDSLRAEVARLSVEIAEKVLGRKVA